jgi:hypothetical protein
MKTIQVTSHLVVKYLVLSLKIMREARMSPSIFNFSIEIQYNKAKK